MATVLAETTGDEFSVSSDLFSTYAIAYKDVKKVTSAPKTAAAEEMAENNGGIGSSDMFVYEGRVYQPEANPKAGVHQ